jgi:hypothetical protein
MQRRDFVKAMMAASVTARAALGQQTAAPPPLPPKAPAAPGPVPWMRGLLEVKPLPMTPLVPDAVAQTNASFFSGSQMATLRHLSEILQPPYNGYPGASDAGAPEFLDFLIGVSPADRQQMYASGLDRLESEARQHFGKSFAGVDAAQATSILPLSHSPNSSTLRTVIFARRPSTRKPGATRHIAQASRRRMSISIGTPSTPTSIEKTQHRCATPQRSNNLCNELVEDSWPKKK